MTDAALRAHHARQLAEHPVRCSACGGIVWRLDVGARGGLYAWPCAHRVDWTPAPSPHRRKARRSL